MPSASAGGTGGLLTGYQTVQPGPAKERPSAGGAPAATAATPVAADQQRGLLPKALDEAFDQMKSRTDRKFEVSVTVVEIYNEVVSDMLSQQRSAAVTVRQDKNQAFSVENVTKVICGSAAEANKLLYRALPHRYDFITVMACMC